MRHSPFIALASALLLAPAWAQSTAPADVSRIDAVTL